MRLDRILLLCLSVLTGIFSYSQSGVTVIDSIQSGGVYRKFRVYKPLSYDGTKPYPVVLNFHGFTSNASQQQVYGNFMPVADTAAFLIVHPEGTNGTAGQFWNAGIIPTPDDVLFTYNLLDTLNADYNIDKNAVYSCGISNGGIFSFYLACNMQGKLAAIASVVGTMFRTFYYNCGPTLPMPVMVINGTGDGIIPYEGNSTPGNNGAYMPIDTLVEKWVRHNQCKSPPSVFNVPDVSQFDNSTAINYRYTGGLDGSTVELYKVIGGSHSWPGAFPIFSNTNQDFNASIEIWRFFRKYKLNQFVTNVGLTRHDLIKNSLKIFPNPAEEKINIAGVENAQYSVYAMDGKQLIGPTSASVLVVSDLPTGLYFLKVEKDQTAVMIKFAKE